MPYELIYTSAEKGLRPGTRGFCTVACTDGITPNMVLLLEQLSAYRHIITPTSPDNPEVHSHLIIPINGLTWHVLSRIADAGLDYTRRSNKIAHHLIFSESEVRQLGDTGPVEILEQTGLFLHSWDQPPQVLPFKRLPECRSGKPGICQKWEEIYGDAGWGGVLAGSFERNLPVCIAFKPKQKRLPLLRESLALLPMDMRWNVSFCTYYTKYPPSVHCECKCVLSGSSEEASVRAIPYTVFLDLSRSGSPVPELDSEMQKYVEFARTGKSIPKDPGLYAGQASLPNDRFDAVFYNNHQEFNFENICEQKDSSRIPSTMKKRAQFNHQDPLLGNDPGANQIYGLSSDSLQNRSSDQIQYKNVPSQDWKQSPYSRFGKKRKSNGNLYTIIAIIIILILGIAFAFFWKQRGSTSKNENEQITPLKNLDSGTSSNSPKQRKPEETQAKPGDSSIPANKGDQKTTSAPEKKQDPTKNKGEDKPETKSETKSDEKPRSDSLSDSGKDKPSGKDDAQEKNSKPPEQKNGNKDSRQTSVSKGSSASTPNKSENTPVGQNDPSWKKEAMECLKPFEEKCPLTFKDLTDESKKETEILDETDMKKFNDFLKKNSLTLEIDIVPLFKYQHGKEKKNETVFKIEKKEIPDKKEKKDEEKGTVWTLYRWMDHIEEGKEQKFPLIKLNFQKGVKRKIVNGNRPFDNYLLLLSWINVSLTDKNQKKVTVKFQFLKPDPKNLEGLAKLFKYVYDDKNLPVPMQEETWELHSTLPITKKENEDKMKYLDKLKENIPDTDKGIKYEQTFLLSSGGTHFMISGEVKKEESK